MKYAPLKQINHNYIDNSIAKWLDIHYGDTSFNGRAVIGYRKPGGGIHTVSARSLTELPMYIKMLHVSTRRDYYISANTVTGTKRRIENLFGLQNIVIDVDCHAEDCPNVADLVETFIWRSKRDLFGAGVIPYPNSIVRTGRGVQFWWAIIPCYGQRKESLYHHNKIKNTFMSHLNHLIEEYPEELEGLNMDSGPSSNAVGYFRIPCTYNTKAKRYSSLEIVHTKRYDQRELTKIEPVEGDTAVASKSVALKESDRFILRNFQSTGVRRVMQLIKLRNLRDKKIGDEARNDFNFVVYNALRMKLDHREAMVHLRAFNAGFKQPMTEREIASSLWSAERKGGYKLTNLKIITLLKITPEEQSIIGLYPFRSNRPAKPNASRDEARKALREDRDSKILALSKKGTSQAEIARILGIGKNTVWRVLKQLKEMVAEIITPTADDSGRHQNGSLYGLLRNRDNIDCVAGSSENYTSDRALFAIPIGDSS